MAKIKVKMNSQGAAELLKSADVRDELTRRARKAQSAAPNSRIVQDTTDRAAVRVASTKPNSYADEAKHGTLTRALDAAGGA